MVSRARLAELLRRRQHEPREVPLTHGQQRLWVADQIEPGSALYNVPTAYRLRGPLRTDPLRRSLDRIVARQAVLRTTFPSRAGQPVQAVAAAGEALLRIEDLGGHPAGERLAEARRRVDQDARTPFDLARGPLFRALLLRLGEDDHVLLLTLHHIVVDAWSLTIFFRELGECYPAYAAGREPDQPELPVQYADFAAWERRRSAAGGFDRQLAYWRGQLAGAPAVLALPADRPRPAEHSHRGALYRFGLPHRLAAELRRLSRKQHATLHMTVLAGYQALLARYTGQTDLVIGSPVGARGHAGLTDLIGFFVNMVALRGRLPDDTTFRELVGQARTVTLEALSNAEVPFEHLVAILQPDRSVARTPFQAQLSVHSAPIQPVALPGLSVTPVLLDPGTAKSDLTLIAEERGGEVKMAFEYATDLFEGSTVARFARHLTALLATAVAEPDRRLGTVPLLSRTERWQVLRGWNRTSHSPPPAATVPRLLGSGLGRDPAAVAVEAAGARLSYGQLARRAYQLAHRLRAGGVYPEAPVGLCLDRSTELVTAVLGVWFAGACWLPLDPDWPPARMRSVLAAAAPALVVTRRPVRDRLGDLLSTVGTVVCLDGTTGEVADRPAAAPPVTVTGDSLARLSYPFGPTGRGTAVAVSHRAIVNLLESFAELARLTPADRWAAVSPPGSESAMLELVLPLVHGASVTMVDATTVASGAALRSFLASGGITALQAPPVRWRSLLSAGGVPDGVRLRVCVGGPLAPDLTTALPAARVDLWNIHGSAETAGCFSAVSVPAPAGSRASPGTPPRASPAPS